MISASAPGDASTAVVVLEMQNGVVGEHGAMPDLAERARGAGLIDRCRSLVDAARAVGVTVLHATVAARPDFVGANTNAKIFALARRCSPPIVTGGEGARPLPELVGRGDLVVERANGLSPFFATDLDLTLRNLGVRSVVLVGVSLNVAVLNAAFDAVNLGYRVVIPRDGVLALPDTYAEPVFDHTLSMLCTVTTTADLLDEWSRVEV